jgi:putative tricarboxylic transport membrane protein
VPTLIGALLIVCAVFLAVDVLRGGRAEAEGGEDVDLSHPSDWRTVLLLVAAFLANVVLIDPVGWWFSGAVLFWGCAYALGSRHYVRDAVLAFALSFLTYYVFAAGLGIGLPAGVLQGIL